MYDRRHSRYVRMTVDKSATLAIFFVDLVDEYVGYIAHE